MDNRKNSGENRDRGAYIFLLSVATIAIGVLVYMWLQPWAYVRTIDGLGLAVLPTIFVALLIISSIIGALLKKWQKESSKGLAKKEPLSVLSVILLSGGVIATTFGLWYVDAVIASGALVLFLLFAGGVRDWRLLVGMPIGMALLIYVLFIKMLGVWFPHAWFGY